MTIPSTETSCRLVTEKQVELVCKRCGEGLSSKNQSALVNYSGEHCDACFRLVTIEKHIEKYLQRSAIPPKYINSTFENFKVYSTATKNAFNLCKAFAHKPGGALFIYGGCGTGKTHLAIAIGRELVLQGKKVHFTSTPGLLYKVRNSFSENFSESVCIERYVSFNCLVLDDLGIEKSSTWAKQTLDYIVSERDNRLHPMVITSNLSLDETAIVSPRITSRLAAGIVIKLCGADYRQKRQS